MRVMSTGAMSRFSTPYQVARPSGVCAASGRPLVEGEPCVATLCDRETDEGFDRLDYALEAWEAGARPARLFSFWRTRAQPPGARPRTFVDDEILVELFHRLGSDDRAQRVAFRFVLALILMRKRLLRFVGRVQDPGEGGAERWRLRLRGSPPDAPDLEVLDPRLTDDDVRELTAQLGEVLAGEM